MPPVKSSDPRKAAFVAKVRAEFPHISKVTDVFERQGILSGRAMEWDPGTPQTSPSSPPAIAWSAASILCLTRCPMPVDLTAIRALLASVAGFTPGPWHRSGFDVVPARMSSEGWHIADCGTSNSPDSAPYNADLIAAAPDLHRELTEAVGEIERLRAHNARMVAQINRLAEGCGRAARHRDPSYPAIGHIITALPGECAGQDWSDLFAAAGVALGRLAAGEVDDG